MRKREAQSTRGGSAPNKTLRKEPQLGGRRPRETKMIKNSF